MTTTAEPVEPEQLALLQAEGAARDKATTKKMRPRTKKESAAAASFVEQFIASKSIDGFPINEADLLEENADPIPEPTVWLAMAKQVEAAYAKSASQTSPSMSASFFASMLLKSRDLKYERDVVFLPPEALRPERILAHVQAIPIKLDPRVAVSIARRAYLLLRNKDRYVSEQAAPALPAPALPDQRVSDAAEPGDEEMCMDCGDVYEGAHVCQDRAKPLPRQAPPEPPPKVEPRIDQELLKRKVTGYARCRCDQLFFVSGGIGHEGEHLTMPAGEILEVLVPNEKDEQDQRRAQEVHKHMLVVVRWRNKARLLPTKTVERVERADWDEQERKRRA